MTVIQGIFSIGLDDIPGLAVLRMPGVCQTKGEGNK